MNRLKESSHLVLLCLSVLIFLSVVTLSRLNGELTYRATQSRMAQISAQIKGLETRNPYLSGWSQSSIGGGGFTTEIRTAPKGFFGLKDEARIYLTNDMNGVLRSVTVDKVTGEIKKWQHLWYPTPGKDEGMITKYVTSIAFTKNYRGGSTDRLIAATRDGIFTYDEKTHKWEEATVPDRDRLKSNSSAFLHANDGRYPWISVVREVSENSTYVLAGIGNTRADSTFLKNAFGLGGVLRSRNGGANWDFVRILAARPSEIVYDIKYLSRNGETHAFIATDQGVYYSRDVFVKEIPLFLQLSTTLPVNLFDRRKPVAEIRGVEVLESAFGPYASPESDTVRMFISLNSTSTSVGGIYSTKTRLSTLTTSLPLAWSRMKTESDSLNTTTGRLFAVPKSTIEYFQIYMGKYNYPFVGVVTSWDGTWRTLITKANVVSEPHYDPDINKAKFASLDFAPKELQPFIFPTLYATWAHGPVYSPGNNSGVTSTRAVRYAVTKYHHTQAKTDFFEGLGYEEMASYTTIPYIDKENPERILFGVADNGVIMSMDGGRSWSSTRPRDKEEWNKDFKSPVQKVYQVVVHPENASCVIASAGVEYHADGNSRANVGELVVNTQGGFGNSTSWESLAGGPSERADLPNGEIHGLAFDVRKTESGKTGLLAAVRGKGIYYGEIENNCTLSSGTKFVKLRQAQVIREIPDVQGVWHHYSVLTFDPYAPDDVYIGRGFPAGGVYLLRLSYNPETGRRLSPASEIFAERFTEVVRGVVGASMKERCLSPDPRNEYNAIDITSIGFTQENIFVATSHGNRMDNDPRPYFCSSGENLLSRRHNYLGGIIRAAKSSNINVDQKDFRNTWVVGGPDKVGNPPNPIFTIGGLAVNPVNQNHIVAITQAGTYARTRAYDNLWSGEEDTRVWGLWTSLDGGQTFSFHSWPFAFPNSFSLKFFPNGKKLIMPSFGNGFWLWEKKE